MYALPTRSPGWFDAPVLTPLSVPDANPAPAENASTTSSTEVAATSFMNVSVKMSAETGILSISTLNRVIEAELRAP
jgi:hypothetical protein